MLKNYTDMVDVVKMLESESYLTDKEGYFCFLVKEVTNESKGRAFIKSCSVNVSRLQ